MDIVARIAEILGGEKILRRKIRSAVDLESLIRQGLPYEALKIVSEQFSLAEKEMTGLLASSPRTIFRRKKQKRLSKTESDQLARLARIVALAEEVLEDRVNALYWMRKSSIALGGRKPLDMLETDIGTQEVTQLLGRIEHGVYS